MLKSHGTVLDKTITWEMMVGFELLYLLFTMLPHMDLIPHVFPSLSEKEISALLFCVSYFV